MPQFSRRQVLVGSGASLSAAGCAASGANSNSQELPNVLWLVSEDNNPLIGAYGDHLAHTPFIDGLAQRGLLYRHAYANAPVCAISRFGILTGVYPESCGPAHHMRARANLAQSLSGYPEYLRQAGYYCTNNAKTDYNCDLDPENIWSHSAVTAHWRNRPAGRPFMSVFNFESTHETSINQPTEGKVRPEDVRVPAYLPDTPDVRRDIASYYNKIEIMDAQIGARLAELEADGLTDSTIIFYYSDHGGVSPRSKRFCYEEGLQACLVIAVPPRYAHLAPAPMGSEIDHPVGLIDLPPTLMALAGIPQPAQMVGRSLLGRHMPSRPRYVFGARNRMDERYDMTRTVTDGRYRYIRNYTPNRPWGQHYSNAWLNKGYQDWERHFRAGTLNPVQARFFGAKPYEELYDLAADPDQITNLVERPEQQRRLETMRVAMDEHMLTINDNGFIPEGSPLQGYRESRVPGAYPLARIMPIASAAAQRDIDQFAAFQEGLTDSNEVIRYWCAQGLLMLGEQATLASSALQRCANEDTSPHVRVVAAEALAGLGDIEAGVRVLADLLDHSAYPVRLQAINALTYVGPSAMAALPAIERAQAEERPTDWTVWAASRYLLAVLRDEYDPVYPVFDWTWFGNWLRQNGGWGGLGVYSWPTS